MGEYLRTLVAKRRARPRDADTDVLTRLIEGDSDDERLTEAELLHQCIFLLNAGHETTTNLIGNALHALTRVAGSEGPADRRSFADSFGRRGIPALRKLQPARQPDFHAACPSSAALRCRPNRASRSASARPTATPRSFPIPTDSISDARRIGTSHSASASIHARASISRGWKGASRLPGSSRAFPGYALAGAAVSGRARAIPGLPAFAGSRRWLTGDRHDCANRRYRRPTGSPLTPYHVRRTAGLGQEQRRQRGSTA